MLAGNQHARKIASIFGAICWLHCGRSANRSERAGAKSQLALGRAKSIPSQLRRQLQKKLRDFAAEAAATETRTDSLLGAKLLVILNDMVRPGER